MASRALLGKYDCFLICIEQDPKFCPVHFYASTLLVLISVMLPHSATTFNFAHHFILNTIVTYYLLRVFTIRSVK